MPFDNSAYLAPAITPAPMLPVVPVSRPDEVLDVLVKARANISDPSRWMKMGAAHVPGSRGNCIIGHTGQLCRAGGLSRAVALTLAAHLPDEHSRLSASAVWMFNDAPTTTHADVLNLFDRAIAARAAEVA